MYPRNSQTPFSNGAKKFTTPKKISSLQELCYSKKKNTFHLTTLDWLSTFFLLFLLQKKVIFVYRIWEMVGWCSFGVWKHPKFQILRLLTFANLCWSLWKETLFPFLKLFGRNIKNRLPGIHLSHKYKTKTTTTTKDKKK